MNQSAKKRINVRGRLRKSGRLPQTMQTTVTIQTYESPSNMVQWHKDDSATAAIYPVACHVT